MLVDNTADAFTEGIYLIKRIFSEKWLHVSLKKYVVESKFSGLTYKSRVKWKILWGIYSATYELLVHRCEKGVEIKGDYVEK